MDICSKESAYKIRITGGHLSKYFLGSSSLNFLNIVTQRYSDTNVVTYQKVNDYISRFLGGHPFKH